ncbi:glycosyltransferase family 2 protein [Methylomonas sp. 2BW1-5-20]|uniref:glycosyltransferase family 2 protein n=1 Tax=Methylomonas sp. 2BW1-5-20 TaxID=3376686 RepID=UPI00404F24F7
MKIWICIPVFNRIEYTLKCLATLNAQTFQNFTVVICDHGSTDRSTDHIRKAFPDVVVLNADSSLWWTGAMNRCVEYVLQHAAEQDFLLTLNNDTELPLDYLAELTAQSIKYPHAVLTSVIHDIETGERVKEGYRQSWLGAKDRAVTFEKHHLPGDENVIAVTLVSGRGTLFPIEVFRKVGLYDERHLPHYFADYDYSHKAQRAGYSIYVCKTCRVFSYVAATGMTTVRDRFSLKSFIGFLTNIKSPANLKARWWYGWNNCPKLLFPSYIVLDVIRLIGGYFRHFLLRAFVR